MLENLKPKATLIRLVGLLDQVPDKKFELFCKRFEAKGYVRDMGPASDKTKKILKDTLYPEFRKIMFSDASDQKHVRYVTNVRSSVGIKDLDAKSAQVYPISVVQSELYLFRGYIGLFSLKIEVPVGITLADLRNYMFNLRSFDVFCSDGQPWPDWISKNYLADTSLRSTKTVSVEADEYSGSKFKLFSAIQLEETDALTSQDRQHLLYDLGTVSHIGSAKGGKYFSPDPAYYESVLQNRVAAYENWEAICLFDSFCSIGSNFLLDREGKISPSWDETYFRVYLFRIFFKYSLYRYNSLVAEADSDKLIRHRNQFDEFLNQYNISHISFNFLPNLIFEKTGMALDLRSEVEMFRDRIRNLSAAIQEEKQAKTNKLLKAVTALSGLGFVFEIKTYIYQVQDITHLSLSAVFILLGIVLLAVGLGIYYYLEPEKVKKWFVRK